MNKQITYNEFIRQKSQIGGYSGFDPMFIPDMAFDFQKSLLNWSVKKGKGAVFADCGLGKSLIELAYGQNIVEKTNGNVLLLTPLAVGIQMEKEADKFGIEAKRSRDGKIKSKITITNYEQLNHFNPDDFSGVVCDESSILKNFKGIRKKEITMFMRKIKYRLLATATAAPNDFPELGTSSEALGYLGYMDMLNKFFKNDMNNSSTGRYRGDSVRWRLKNHAHESFWRWITSWARAARFPSDLGFSDDGYILPELIENDHELKIKGRSIPGVLPGMEQPAVGPIEQREEINATIKSRCEKAAEIAMNIDDFSVLWCNRNPEGDLLEKIIPGAVQISGKHSDEQKEERLTAFTNGEIKKLITKPKIGAWGLNWQHCNHVVFFPSYSYEQYYQAIRRCWRFGQERKVNVDMVFTEGQKNMILAVKRKQNQAEEMFTKLVQYMNDSLSINHVKKYENKMEVPSWL